MGEEPAADDEDERHGEDEDGEGGDECPGDGHGGGVAFGKDGRVARIGGGVDAHGAGGNLADGQDVGEFLCREPPVLFDDSTLDEGDHRIASTEGEETDDEEGDEELEENHLSINFEYVQPAASAMRMTRTGLTPKREMRSAARMGIQTVRSVTPALRARVKTGAAMSATTAGRMPIKMCWTAGMSLN